MELIAAHTWEREALEHYVEPFWCSERLFAEEKFEGFVRDPCCGFGRIPDSARAAGLMTYASDIVNRGCGAICSTRVEFSKCAQGRDDLPDSASQCCSLVTRNAAGMYLVNDATTEHAARPHNHSRPEAPAEARWISAG